MQVRNYQWNFSDAKNMANMGRFEKLLFYALSLIFPEGERFFVRSVKQFADRAESPQEKEEIKAFIGQEIQHGRAHELFNESIMSKDYDTKPFSDFYDFAAYKLIEPAIARIFGPEMNLAITAASEHYTATWAEAELKSGRFDNFRSESLKRLAVWHSLEELEHKHVAFDLLKKVKPDYAFRIAGLIFSTAQFVGFMTVSAAMLLAQEKNMEWGSFLKDAYKDARNQNGYSNLFMRAFFEYLRPDFHPSQHDDAELRTAAREFLKERGAA